MQTTMPNVDVAVDAVVPRGMPTSEEVDGGPTVRMPARYDAGHPCERAELYPMERLSP
jgi:hypothetical protein